MGPGRLPYLYGTAWKKDSTAELVVQAVRAGFRGIDTACQPKHYREDLVGEALRRLARDGISRDQLWLQTKYTPVPGQDPNNIPYDPNAPLEDQVRQSIQRSLKNLNTSQIDSLVMHSPMQSLSDTLRVWSVFEDAVDAGTVRELGICNCYDQSFFKELHAAARIKPSVLQNRFYKEAGFDTALRAFCLQEGIMYQTFWTLTANPDALNSMPLRAAAARLQATPQQVMFGWLIQSGHQPLTGTKSPVHMMQDLDVLRQNLELSPQEMTSIGALFR